MSDDAPLLPDELDEGLAFAYGEDAVESTSPSVIERIGEISGSMARVNLRDDSAGDTPMLKPLGPDDTREAGKYVVHGELGRGGVGVGLRGHDQDLGRDVAMKFLHEKYKDEPAILQRFVEEAQIGGQLQHPGIVPVYDLGMVDGKPFFAMKLVKGRTLAKKLAERATPGADRRTFLAIFEDVCQTLAYAHARGVVHRDLKPANIMIGSFGEVQVVDWGMGKVLPSGGVADEQLAAERQAQVSVIETVRSGGHGTQSLVGSMMGTPAYMPPEQARGDVEHMDERSDVFALGAILCEILTGKPPYTGTVEEQIGMAAMAKLEDAHARLAACGGEQEMVELATRCLMPAPAARPKSAEAVAKAVHEHLAAVESRVHEARVEAAEARVRAAALKRTQTMGISLTVVIAAGLLASLWFWRAADAAADSEGRAKLAALASAQEAEDNERLALEKTGVAERELARAVEIKDLITEMLESVKPEKALTADTRLLEDILETTSRRLAGDAIQDEVVAAELHGVIGNVYLALGLDAEADRHLPAAVEIYERTLGEEHVDTLRRMNDLASLRKRQRRYAEAEAMLLRVLEIEARAPKPNDWVKMGAWNGLANVYSRLGRHADSEALHLQVLELVEAEFGADPYTVVTSQLNLSGSYFRQGRFDESEELLLRTRALARKELGDLHPRTLMCQTELAAVLFKLGRADDAETTILEVLPIMIDVMGAEHPATLNAKTALVGAYFLQGRYAECEAILVPILQSEHGQYGEALVDHVLLLNNLAQVFQRQGRAAEAEPLLSRALEVATNELGEAHDITLVTHLALASLYFEQGRYPEALALFRLLLETTRRALGEEAPRTLEAMMHLGSTLRALGRHDDVVELLAAGYPTMQRVLGPQHYTTQMTSYNLLRVYEQLGRPEDALPLNRELLELNLARAASPDADYYTLNLVAWTLLTIEEPSLRDPERAKAFAERASAVAEADNPDRLWLALDTLAFAQHETGDTAAAIVTLRRALSLTPEGATPEVSARLAEYEAATQED